MKFKQLNPAQRHRSRPGMWRRYRTILILCPMLFTAYPVVAQTLAARTTAIAATDHKPVPTIALKSGVEPSLIDSSPADFRLLGYGLFLLQIGLIPLKLAKGNLIQTIDRN
jgi:hypothetical protein